MKVLLIEDDSTAAAFVKGVLSDAGHFVDVCGDGETGLKQAKGGDYDALVVDRMLPGLDGLRVVKGYRDSGGRAPALFLSALGEVDHRVEGLQAGGDDYLTKPYAPSELVARGLKEAFPELRPDGSDRKSFPSAHTSLAFAAASTLYNRQGGKVGIPAFAVAAFVGLARVQADKHHWYDCVAGAGVGLASGFLITRKANQRVAVVPWGDSKGGGFSLAARF